MHLYLFHSWPVCFRFCAQVPSHNLTTTVVKMLNQSFEIRYVYFLCYILSLCPLRNRTNWLKNGLCRVNLYSWQELPTAAWTSLNNGLPFCHRILIRWTSISVIHSLFIRLQCPQPYYPNEQQRLCFLVL